MIDVRVLGSCGSRVPGQQATCLLVNGRIAVDAGGLTGALTIDEQLAVDHVLLSHAHLDHIYDLAFMTDNVMARRSTPLRVWAPREVLSTLRAHLFNDQLWPDMSRVEVNGFPVLEFKVLPPDTVTCIDGLEVSWAPTAHTVFSAGYVLANAQAAILFTGDTGTTTAIWELGNRQASLQAVFAEVSFPNRLTDLAVATGHLTPQLLAAELHKLADSAVPVKIFHMKPQYLDEICRELAPQSGRCEVLSGNEHFRFCSAELS